MGVSVRASLQTNNTLERLACMHWGQQARGSNYMGRRCDISSQALAGFINRRRHGLESRASPGTDTLTRRCRQRRLHPVPTLLTPFGPRSGDRRLDVGDSRAVQCSVGFASSTQSIPGHTYM
eukprot:scaffold2051_cov389-Prasinococcus_capsulatus_cf.AAC.3